MNIMKENKDTLITPIIAICIFLDFIFFHAAALHARYTVRISPEYNFLDGHTTYQLGGKNVQTLFFEDGTVAYSGLLQRDPTSELKFPFDTPLISLQCEFEISSDILFRLDFKNDIGTSYAGKMEDSDWGVWQNEYDDEWSNPDSLDIYSESDADITVRIIDINLRKILGKYTPMQVSLIGGGGLIYQKFNYDIKNTHQWSPSSALFHERFAGDDTIFLSGMTLNYDVEYMIPYIEGGLKFIENKYEIDGFIAYSFITQVRDKDNHLRRSPPFTSKGDYDGKALILTLNMVYHFHPSVALSLCYRQSSIVAEGTQQYSILNTAIERDSETYLADIYGKIESSIASDQQVVGIGIEFTF